MTGVCCFLAADEISGGFPCLLRHSRGLRRRGGPGAPPQRSLEPSTLSHLRDPLQLCALEAGEKEPFVLTSGVRGVPGFAPSHWCLTVTFTVVFTLIPIFQMKKLRPRRG